MVRKQQKFFVMKNDKKLPPVSDALLREYREYFLDFDDDGDGKLSKIEFMNMVEQTGVELDFQEMKKAYNSADSDGDGMITFRNFLAAYSLGVGSKTVNPAVASNNGNRPFSEQLSIRTPAADRKQRYYSQYYPDMNQDRNGLLKMMEKLPSPSEESKDFITEADNYDHYSDDEIVSKQQQQTRKVSKDPFKNRRAKSMYHAPTRPIKEFSNQDFIEESENIELNPANNSNGNSSPKRPLSKQLSDDAAIRKRRGLSLHLAMNPDEVDYLTSPDEKNPVREKKSPMKESNSFIMTQTDRQMSPWLRRRESRGSTRRAKNRESIQEHDNTDVSIDQNRFGDKETRGSIRRNTKSYDSIEEAGFGDRESRGSIRRNKYSLDSIVDHERFADKDNRRSLRRPRKSKQEFDEKIMKRNTCHFDYYSSTKPEEIEDFPKPRVPSDRQTEYFENKEDTLVHKKRPLSKIASEQLHRRKLEDSPKLPLRQQYSDDIVARKGSPKAQNRCRSSTTALPPSMDQQRRGSGGNTPDTLAEFRKRFQDMDKTGDGKLQWSDILKLTEKVGLELKAKQASEVYKAVSESEDGRIGYKAFIDAYTKQVLSPTTTPETQRFRRESSSFNAKHSAARRQRSATIGPTSSLAPTRDSVKSWLARRQEPSSAKLKNLLGTELKEYCKCFWNSDLDDDGKLSTREFSRMLDKLGMKLNTKELNKAFTEADENRDGHISFNEFLSTYFDRNILQVLTPGQIQNQLSKMSGDSRLNKAECFAIMKQFGNDLNDRQLNKFMSLMKNDKNGQVSLDDFYMFLGYSA